MSLMRDRFKDAILTLENDVKKWYHHDLVTIAGVCETEMKKILGEQNADITKLSVNTGSATLAEAIAKENAAAASSKAV